MTNLQRLIQGAFPNDYTPETWKDLLQRFIDQQQEGYEKRVAAHMERMKIEDHPDPTSIEAGYPVHLVEFGEACEELAIMNGFTFRALAIGMYDSQRRAEYFEKLGNQYKELCHDFDEAILQLREQHIALRNSATIGKSLN